MFLLVLEFVFRIVLIFFMNLGKCGGIWFNSLFSRLRKFWLNVVLLISRMFFLYMLDVRMLVFFMDFLNFLRILLVFLIVCFFCLCFLIFVCRSVNIFVVVMVVFWIFVCWVSFSFFFVKELLIFCIVFIWGDGVFLVFKLNNKSLFILLIKYMYF